MAEVIIQDANIPNVPPAQPLNQTVTTTPPATYESFPYTNALGRLANYDYFYLLLTGQHFEAFNIRIDSVNYSRAYSKLRYVSANFAGLLSKICADMLFSEPITIKAGENTDKTDQEWIDKLVYDNKLNEQLYESAVSNSALGDAVFKIRIDKRHPNDKEPTIIIEDFTPTIYFPQVDGFNVRAEPIQIELAWTCQIGEQKYLRKEIHTPGKIVNEVWEMKNNKVIGQVDLSVLNLDLESEEETKIDRYLVIHIPNWKTGNRHFGISDYYDMDKLFYAINNRLSKVDNILDKHSDPILVIPDGILDEDGKVAKSALNMIEVKEGEANKMKPEYIVWNANLEAAFTQIEKLMDFLMMTGEISPDVLGMGQGLNDSGRALKFKLMRTIAKVARKKLYYDRAIKEIVYVAQLLAKAWDVGVGSDFQRIKGEPTVPDILWQDGLPIDNYEEVDMEIKRIDAGIESKVGAIQALDNLDEEAAEEKLKEIQDENPLPVIDGTIDTTTGNDAEDQPNMDNNQDNQNGKSPKGSANANS